MRSERLIASLLLLLALAFPAAAQEPWPEKLWNPHADEGDLRLPLPCGGGIVFRPVAIDAEENWLSDLRFELGGPSEDFAFSEHPHHAWVAGSFSTEGKPGRRVYYLGKYEVTKDQYAAVMDEKCPTAKPLGSEPVDQLSWFDAVSFTERLSTWLLRNAKDKLPVEDRSPGFVRLPTESEWEFAARGGMAVSDSERSQPVPPMAGGLGDYAWFKAPESCGGSIHVIGQKKGNPLLLHDMLGNVAEIVLEPYRMTRGGRLHGQAGGFVAKGGSCRDAEAALRSSSRTELVYFDASSGAAARPRMTGFRVALVAPVQVSQKRIEALRRDWQAIGDSPEGEEADPVVLRSREVDAAADPVQALDMLAEAAKDPDLKSDLGAIAAAYRNERAQREEQESRAARAALVAGAALVRTYRINDDAVRLREKQLASACTGQEAVCRDTVDKARLRRRLTGSAYLDLLLQVVSDYPQASLEAQLPAVEAQYASLDAEGGTFRAAARRFVTQAARWRQDRGIAQDKLLEELVRD